MTFYGEGREARQNGQPRESNPHAEGTQARRLWDEGWQDADTILRSLETYQ